MYLSSSRLRHSTLLALFALLALAQTSPASAQEVYYGYNPDNNGTLALTGFEPTTTWRLIDLSDSSLVDEGTIAALERDDLALGDLRQFKLETSAPLMALHGYDCCNFSGAYFYTGVDGKKFWGQRFIISPIVASGAS